MSGSRFRLAFFAVLLASCTTPLVPGDGGADGGTPDLSGFDMGSCPAGHFDLDGDAANGCEYACTLLGTADAPDSAYVDSNCDGIDGDIAHGVFVSTAGDDANPGTMQRPVRTIGHGLAIAGPRGADVYVDQGLYAESLMLVDHVAVYGGFDRTASHSGAPAGFWDRRAGVTSRVMGGAVAVESASITMGATLGWLTIDSAATTDPGAPSIGIWAHDSTGTLTLDTVIVTSGDGGPGTAGMAGHAGGMAGNGTGVTPGTSSCGHPGGMGGAVATAGMDAPDGAMGGGAGTSASGCPSTGTNGTVGGAGADAAAVMNGAAGNAAGSVAFSGAWMPSDGMAGADGADGHGGAGGGGSGSGYGRLGFACAAFSGFPGGGGGGGGCGGTGGAGGGGGGASIGVLAAAATVALSNCDITSARGGDGGAGGDAGTGSAGGTGQPPTPGTLVGGGGSGTSGGGGHGGRGGDGGHGGGGAGGPSFALAHGGIGALTVASTALHVGSGGTGGASMGNAGPNGAAETMHEF